MSGTGSTLATRSCASQISKPATAAACISAESGSDIQNACGVVHAEKELRQLEWTDIDIPRRMVGRSGKPHKRDTGSGWNKE